MRDRKRDPQDLEAGRDPVDSSENGSPRRAFAEPRLDYVKPKLVRHGRIEKVTAGFFGQFYP